MLNKIKFVLQRKKIASDGTSVRNNVKSENMNINVRILLCKPKWFVEFILNTTNH